MKLTRILLGRPLTSQEHSERKLGTLGGIPAVGLDALASSSYGPEAALAVLIPLGSLGLAYIGPIISLIILLLGMLYLSYRQTIAAYPSGGGSYTVAKENLGTNTGLIAAAALLIDYVLNVAVAVSAGVGAVVSAFPQLHGHILALCLALLTLIMLVNLRGTVESGWAFALPTYMFVLAFAMILIVGFTRVVSSGGHPIAEVELPSPGRPSTAISLWLLAHAFASGCTAMTGVEAVSNGITAFKEPAVNHARRTLTCIVGILALLLAGIAYLTRSYGIGAMNQEEVGYQSVMSQLVAAVAGRGWVYYVTISSLLAVLALSANTSFVDFPRLCRVIAADKFLPAAFTIVGRRLVYSMGIIFLAITSGLLLIVFGGITDRLIPLFAVGAFLAFTLSQAGMVAHWWRTNRLSKPERHGERIANRVRLWINGIGTFGTGAALVVIVSAKFMEGAWIILLAIPALLMLFKLTKRHYVRLARKIRLHAPLDLSSNEPPVVLLPTEGWNQLTHMALRFGMRLSPDIIAVHLYAADPAETEREGRDDIEELKELQTQWETDVLMPAEKAGMRPPRLDIVRSPFRKFIDPLLRFIETVKEQFPERQIAVIVPEIIKRHWWQYLLHMHRAERLKAALLRSGGPRLVLVNMPYYLEDVPPPETATDEIEPADLGERRGS